MKKISLMLLILTLLMTSRSVLAATSTAKIFSGQVIYTADKSQELWLVNLKNFKRSLVNDYKETLNLFKSKFVGISELNFKKIIGVDSKLKNNEDLAKKLAGKIILRTEKKGEAWYINPIDLKKYDLSTSSAFFKNLSLLATQVTPEQLAQIHKPELKESLDKYSSYEYTKVKTERGYFYIDLIKIDLSDPALKILTDTANETTCKSNCAAKPLADYVFPAHAFAGMNGTYFCSSAGCGAANYYFFPVYNSAKKTLINESELKYWTTGPMMVFDTNNKFYYFKDARDFKSVADFEAKYGVTLQAAMGNKPRLVEEGKNALIEWEVDAGQRYGKYLRNAIGYQDHGTGGHGIVYLVIAHSATVDDLAVIMKTLKMDYALNLDGGSSAALFYNDEYMIGPGRDIPNVIMFAK
ncbi:MAG: phosphodiester glycosidase family protein [Candidatus Falkowbacteria bacterium]